ncbi:MAG: TetR/AcrR family transcriptional regulator [Actinomycetota bacterium]|nr:TetR/AcrR family transcriptional regulator [Actinomycetota bacterium]
MPRRDKRADIVNAGIRIFSQKGFQHCSVEDILKEANVARATFYSYFDSKKDLFVELVDSILNTMYEIVRRELEEMPNSLDELQARAKQTILEVFEFFQDNLDFAAIYIQEVMGLNPEIDFKIIEWQDRTSNVLKGLLQKGIDQGFFRPIDVEVVARIVSGAPQHVGITQFLYTDQVDIPRFADAMADYLIYGVANKD